MGFTRDLGPVIEHQHNKLPSYSVPMLPPSFSHFSPLLSLHHLLTSSTCHRFFFFFGESIPLDISGYITQAVFELAIFLPLPPLCYSAGLCHSSFLSKLFSHNIKVVQRGGLGQRGKTDCRLLSWATVETTMGLDQESE